MLMDSSRPWKLIGGVVMMQFENLHILVTIQDTRNVWGRTDFLVAPVEGMGSQWVSSDRIRITERTISLAKQELSDG